MYSKPQGTAAKMLMLAATYFPHRHTSIPTFKLPLNLDPQPLIGIVGGVHGLVDACARSRSHPAACESA